MMQHFFSLFTQNLAENLAIPYNFVCEKMFSSLQLLVFLSLSLSLFFLSSFSKFASGHLVSPFFYRRSQTFCPPFYLLIGLNMCHTIRAIIISALPSKRTENSCQTIFSCLPATIGIERTYCSISFGCIFFLACCFKITQSTVLYGSFIMLPKTQHTIPCLELFPCCISVYNCGGRVRHLQISSMIFLLQLKKTGKVISQKIF